MKNLKEVLVIGLIVGLMSSCTSSATEDFDDINGNVKKKTLKSITATNPVEIQESISSNFIYDSDNKLMRMSGTEGNESVSMDYKNDGTSIKAGIDNEDLESFSIEELYKAPYNVYETGEVLAYDANKNPSKIAFRDTVYDYETNTYSVETQTAEMTYDDKPNLYFATLEAAGLVEILDGVSLDFGINTQASEVIKARQLLATNNLIKIVYKNADSEVLATLSIDYIYDVDGYPIKGTGTLTSNNKYEDNEPISIDVVYSYN
ncbi:hypothetical protein [Tenacibaculum aestuariivivum]|uniref:hypothetical protein n=1 Tax=Tenacibaculum aestuariivivum TaxID=2006131 RepID=UPI003AB51C48